MQEETNSVYAKLLKFQEEVGAVKKDSDNPFFHSKYADINSYLKVIKPVLTKVGLVLIQPIRVTEGKSFLSTVVIDPDTGDKIDSYLVLPELADVQKLGGVITYYRRYEIQSLLALEAEDDDGNVASGNDKATSKDKKVVKNDEKFFEDMQPTDEEIILQKDRLESAQSMDDLKKIWKTVPPMVQPHLEKVKDDLKFKLV